jgi:hypothetical protein
MGWCKGGAVPRVAAIEYDTRMAFSDLNDYGVQISYIQYIAYVYPPMCALCNHYKSHVEYNFCCLTNTKQHRTGQ